jgi:protein-disulfide isomerase
MNLVKISGTDHVQGSAAAPITLIEYADYQCPYCRQAYYIVKDLQKQLGPQLQFCFRNYPLQDLHPHALHAAVAAETADMEGKFWEMHDKIFENQRLLDDRSLLNYAIAIGLDENKFIKDFGADAPANKIQADLDSGNKAKVEATPTFFVNGQLFEGTWMTDDFLNYLKSL